MPVNPVPAVAYYRMSSSQQEKSIPQQRAEMAPRCKLEGVEVVQEFADEGISGGGMKKRDAFGRMLEYCRQAHRDGAPIQAIVCYDTSRFSRATSMETAHSIWEFQRVGVHRVLTYRKWHDFRQKEDRAFFLLEQDLSNHAYLTDHSLRVLRGKKATAMAGYFTGGVVPCGFDRLLLDDKDRPQGVYRRGQAFVRPKGWHIVLIPIPADDPDPARQLERQTVEWLYRQFAETIISYRSLAAALNERGVPGPGSHFKKPTATTWGGQTVRQVLTNPVYKGASRWGMAGKGSYYRIVDGEIQPVEPGAEAMHNKEGVRLIRIEAGGLVDEELWERVQEKIKARKLGREKCRSNGFLLTPLVHCGVCGGRMYGQRFNYSYKGKPLTYLRYVCGRSIRDPGACKNFSILETRLLKVLVRKLQDVYLAPARLAGLEAQLREKIQRRSLEDPQRSQRLKARVDELDAEIVLARRNLLRAGDAVFQEASLELQAWIEKRDRLVRELHAAERAQAVPATELEARVDVALKRLQDLRGELTPAAARPRLREVLRLLVSRIDLHFDGGRRVKRNAYAFVKGIIKVRAMVNLSGYGKDE